MADITEHPAGFLQRLKQLRASSLLKHSNVSIKYVLYKKRNAARGLLGQSVLEETGPVKQTLGKISEFCCPELDLSGFLIAPCVCLRVPALNNINSHNLFVLSMNK